MSEKPKQSKATADYRLEKAFQFTLDDISANRAGFMSLSQQWDVPLWARGASIAVMNSRLGKSLMPKTRRQVIHTCGKIGVSNQLRDVHGGRFQMNAYIVSIANANLRFSVSQQEAQVLSDGMVYHIYYDPETMHILSLERATSC